MLTTEFSNLKGRLVRPKSADYSDSESSLVVEQNGPIITLNGWPTWASRAPDVVFSFNPEDIFGHNEACHTLEDTNLIVHDQGFLGFQSFSLIMKRCNFQVHNGGNLQFGVFTRSTRGTPMSTRGCILTLHQAGYGANNYRSPVGSPAGDRGTLVMVASAVRLIGSSRNDFDVHSNSRVIMYATSITGTSTAYHHFASQSMRLNDMTVEDAYSMEFMSTPLEMENIKTIGCNSGLSFYSSDHHVFIQNMSARFTKSIFLKRNNTGCLRLVDSHVPDDAVMTGRAPIQSLFSHTDLFTVANVPLALVEVLYTVSTPLSIYSANNTTIRFRGTPVQSQVFQGSTVILLKELDVLDATNAFMLERYNVVAISGSRDITLDRAPPEDMSVFREAIVVEVRISDAHGEAGKVLLPIEYWMYSAQTRVAAASVHRYWRHTGMNIAARCSTLPHLNHRDVIDVNVEGIVDPNVELQQRLQEALNALVQLDVRVEALRLDNLTLQQEIGIRDAHLEACGVEKDRLLQEIESRDHSLEHLIAEGKVTADELNECKGEVESLREVAAASALALRECEVHLALLKEELLRTVAELTTCREEGVTARDVILRLRTKVRASATDLERCQFMLRKSAETIATLELDMNAAYLRVQEMECEIRVLQERIQHLEAQLIVAHAGAAEVPSLKHRILQLERDNETSQDTIKELKRSITQAEIVREILSSSTPRDDRWVPHINYTMLGVMHTTFFRGQLGVDLRFVPKLTFGTFLAAREYMNQFMIHAEPLAQMHAMDRVILSRWQVLPASLGRQVLGPNLHTQWYNACVHAINT